MLSSFLKLKFLYSVKLNDNIFVLSSWLCLILHDTLNEKLAFQVKLRVFPISPKINDYLFTDTPPIQVKKTQKTAVNDVKVNDCEKNYKMKRQVMVNTGDIRPSVVEAKHRLKRRMTEMSF